MFPYHYALRAWGRARSRVSGREYDVRVRRAVVDARYLEPTIPATTPPPFGVADGVRVVAVNDLVAVDAAPSQYVIVGSGKSATDANVWLLGRGRSEEHTYGPQSLMPIAY